MKVFIAWYDVEDESTNNIIGIYTTKEKAKEALVSEIETSRFFGFTKEEADVLVAELLRKNWKATKQDGYWFGVYAVETDTRQEQYWE